MQITKNIIKTFYSITCIIFAIIFGLSVMHGESGSGFLIEHTAIACTALISAISMICIRKRIAKFSLAGTALILSLMTTANSMKIFSAALRGSDSNIETYSPSAFEIVFYLATPVLFISAFVFSLFQLAWMLRR